MQTVTPPNLNDQHNWGGHAFHPPSVTSPTVDNGLNQATIVAHGRHDTRAQPLSQAGVIASSSDNLFHPVPNIPSLSAFTLPPVPSNPVSHGYNPPDTFQHPLSYRSSLSSYNNPHFQIPSSHTQALLGPPPPFPPRICSRPVFSINLITLLHVNLISLRIHTFIPNLHTFILNLHITSIQSFSTSYL